MDGSGVWRGVPRKVFSFFVDHWFIAGLIPPLPGLVSLALRLFNVSVQPWMTWLGTGVIIAASLFSLAKSAAVKYEISVRHNNDFVLARLLTATNAVTRAKLERFTDYIRQKQCPLPSHPFDEITQPEAQLRCIVEQLQRALVEIHGMEADGVGVSLACQANGTWRWLVRSNVDDDLELDVLTSNSQCAFHHVMVAKTREFLFHADKQKGLREKTYLSCKRDGENPSGSIIVERLDLPVDGSIFSVALSITTYGKQLCEESDLEAKEKIRTTLLSCFKWRLRLELCLYYIKNVMVPASPTCGARISTCPPIPLPGS